MTKYNSIVKRFVKGIIAGVVSSVSLISLTQPEAWSDMTSLLNTFALACAYGAFTGFLLALQKWASWEDQV